MTDQPVVWHEPEAGFQYLPDTVSVTGEHQAEKLDACGIDASLFGGQVDPAFLIGIAIHAGIRSGISAEGNINGPSESGQVDYGGGREGVSIAECVC